MPISAATPEFSDDEQRRRLRDAMIARREAIAVTTIAAWNAAICRHLLECFPAPPGRQIAFCWPVRNEPDLRPAVAAWAQSGAGICLPVVTGPGVPLSFRAWTPETPMFNDRYGIPTPVATAGDESVIPDVLLMPLNAFDELGYRIGYGGGYFDRTLAALSPKPLAIGVGFEIGRVATIGPQAHDQRLDWIVTETVAVRMG